MAPATSDRLTEFSIRPAMLSAGSRIRAGLTTFPVPLPLSAMAQLAEPTLTDVLEAARQIRPYLSPTPLRRYPALDRLVGTEGHVQHENHNPTGAVKGPGGVNLG